MSDKLLTVIVPSYNMEEYLPKCLGSLIVPDKAMLKRLDVIVVNDGSKDRTSEIAHDFEKRYPGVFRVFDKENGHYGSCINAALPMVYGFYVRVLDADDSVDTNRFLQHLRILDEEIKQGNSSADLIVSEYACVDSGGQVLRTSRFGLDPSKVKSLMDIGDVRPVFPCIETHSIVYKTSIFQKIPYRQTEGISYTDVQWDILPMSVVRRVLFFPDTVTRYLVGREGQSMNPATYARNFDQMVHMTEDVVACYPLYFSQCEKNSEVYFARHVKRLLKVVYHGVLFGINGRKTTGNLLSLDNMVKTVPDLFQFTEELRYESKLLPFRYVHEWRKRKSKSSFRFLCFRYFLFLRSCKHAILSVLINCFVGHNDSCLEAERL